MTNGSTINFGLSFEERWSLYITIIMTGVTLVLLYIFMYNGSGVGIALSAGAIGGFLHEFVQSKGKILFVQRKEDGLYLGSIAGLILGMVAGILIMGGTISASLPAGPLTDEEARLLLFESLIAGLALKGVAEGATSPAKSKDEFEIVSIDFVDGGAKKVKVHVKNNMRHKLGLQLITIEEKGGATSTFSPTTNSVDPILTGLVLETSYTWSNGKEYEIIVITNYGKEQRTAKAPN